jgi:hypothetical protein
VQHRAAIRATRARVAELERSGGTAAVEAAKAADAEFAKAVVRTAMMDTCECGGFDRSGAVCLL